MSHPTVAHSFLTNNPCLWGRQGEQWHYILPCRQEWPLDVSRSDELVARGSDRETWPFWLFLSFLLCSKHRCDGWSYSGNGEEILRTQGTCQRQQTRETKVAWDALGAVETLVLTTYDRLRVCETTCATVLLKSTWFQVSSLATACNPKESHRTFGTLHRTKEGLDAPGLICIPMRKIDHVLLTVA